MGIDHRDPHTSVRASPGKGLGLFTRKNINPGTVVARMRHTKTIRPAQWLHYHRTRRLPHDAAIHKPRSPLMYYDATFTSMLRVPRWYRLNHSRNPNTQPKEVNGGIVWVTTRRVLQNEELTFKYDRVPSHWT